MRNKIFSILALIAFVLCAQISVFATSGGGTLWPNPPLNKTELYEGNGDLLVRLQGEAPSANDTQDQAIYTKAGLNDQLIFTGTYDSSSIAELINDLNEQWIQKSSDVWHMTGEDWPVMIQSTYTARITLPDGLIMPDKASLTLGDIAFTSGSNLFYVPSMNNVDINGNELSVTMVLQNEETNFEDLRAAINQTGKLSVSLPKVAIDKSKVKVGDKLTVTGTVDGEVMFICQSPSGKTVLDAAKLLLPDLSEDEQKATAVELVNELKSMFPGENYTINDPFFYPEHMKFHSFQDPTYGTDSTFVYPDGLNPSQQAEFRVPIQLTLQIVDKPEEPQDILIPCPWMPCPPVEFNPPMVTQPITSPYQPTTLPSEASPVINLPSTGEHVSFLPGMLLLAAGVLVLARRRY